MFRDQSAEVVHKARGSKHKGLSTFPANIEYSTLETHEAPQRKVQQVNSILPSLDVCLEDQAVCFFFSNYVLEPEKAGKGVYEFIPALYGGGGVKDSALAYVVPALGLAGLSGRGAPQLMPAAHLKYTSALRLINRALRDPEAAAQDQTLMSVLLLGLYEVDLVMHPIYNGTKLING
jgi:hypothetical protein